MLITNYIHTHKQKSNHPYFVYLYVLIENFQNINILICLSKGNKKFRNNVFWNIKITVLN